MTIRPMTPDDLTTVLGWAANEGWNPGLEDAEAFLAADPAGFLVKEVDGAPVAAISVVNHDAAQAFLGLYLCKPAYRGRGHGMEVWRAGIAHAGTRSIGLDGVPDQQANYARSGFTACGRTIRFSGSVPLAPDPDVRPAGDTDLPELIARDRAASGLQRDAFAGQWLSPRETRKTLVLSRGGAIDAIATFRRCGSGTKIGPLLASTEADARALLSSNPFGASAHPTFVDVQGDASPLAKLLGSLGFEAGFETARMYRGAPPNADPPPFAAIATMELG